MSIYVSTWCWQHSKASGTDLLVLLAIADQANDQGENAWPSQGTLSERCRVSPKTIQRSVQKLVTIGELAVEHHAGPASRGATKQRPNRYSFPAYQAHQKGGQSDQASGGKGGQSDVPLSIQRVDISGQRVDTAVTAYPSLDPSIKTLSEGHAPDGAVGGDQVIGLFDHEPVPSSKAKKKPATTRTEGEGSTVANTVVARWIDGYRETGTQPPQYRIKQVGREAKQLLEAGNDPERVRAAAFRAGQSGSWLVERWLTSGSRSGRVRLEDLPDDDYRRFVQE